MNEQNSTMTNPKPQSHNQQQMMVMNQSQMMSMSQMNTQPQQQQVIIRNQKQYFPHQVISNSPYVNSLSHPQMGMHRSYGTWAPPFPQQQFPKLNSNMNPVGRKPPPSVNFGKSAKQFGLGARSNWKGKKVGKPNDKRRNDPVSSSSTSAPLSGVNIGSGSGNMNYNYNPPNLNDLQNQNRLKARKFFPQKNFNKNNNMNLIKGSNRRRFAPFAPRNTTSFLIRAKKSGGIAPLVSPYPVTPAVLPTPIFSPSREFLVDTAKEEWGLDGYGSMKGLIRLRSPGHEMEANEDDEEDEGGSSESDVEEHVEVERRLDHDLSRFEMISNPNNVGALEYHNVLENRVDDQDAHIAQLEEENLILKDRLFLMERELGDLRRRLQFLEKRGDKVEDENDELLDNVFENESDSQGDETNSMEENDEYMGEDNFEEDGSFKGNDESNKNNEGVEAAKKPVQDVLGDVEVKMEIDKSEENISDVEVKDDNRKYEFVESDKDVGNIADVEKKQRNNQFVEPNKDAENCKGVDDKEETQIDVNKQNHVGLGTDSIVNAEASEPPAAGGDIGTELIRQAEDKDIRENL